MSASWKAASWAAWAAVAEVGREPAVDDEVRVERVDERAGAAAERVGDRADGSRFGRGAGVGGGDHARGEGPRVGRRAAAEGAGERPPVHLEIPAARGAARARGGPRLPKGM